jgi:SAM-dependent methyltransferase
MATPPVSDNWERGDAYERYVGRWSRQVAPLFLDWLALPAGLRWVDVGCGTGALSAAILDACGPLHVTGVDPSEGFLATAAENLGDRAELVRGAGDAIPLPDGAADAVVSGLALNFMPDAVAALAEMRRVGGHGTVAAYIWDYAGRMDFMRLFWDAAVAQDETARALDEGVRFPMADAGGLSTLFESVGLTDVAVTAIDVPTVFADFDALWEPFLGAQGSAPSYLASLDLDARHDVREHMRHNCPIAADGSISLIARAWAVRGVSAGSASA